MSRMNRWVAIGAAPALLLAGHAQAQTGPAFGVEATTDESRRGLSWSDGRASISADAATDIGPLEADVRVSALRGADRHGGGDAVADASLGSRWRLADVTLRLRATAHLFAGAEGKRDYGEVTASANYAYGPVQLDAGASYAPHQDAIGGSNLYLFAGASAGVPATPFTVVANIGRSSGDADDARAQRLRPGGRYLDWRLGVEHVQGPLVLALDYVGTDFDDATPDALVRHDGDRLVARARFSF